MIAYEKYLRPEDMTRLMLIATVKKLIAELATRPSAEATAKQDDAPDPRPTIRAGSCWDSV